MAREIPEHNPGNFEPTMAAVMDQAALVAAREKSVRQYCLDTMRDSKFRTHADPGSNDTMAGAVYRRVLMLAKAAMINNGRNLIYFWNYFRVELGIPWDIFMWESDAFIVSTTGAQMNSAFHRTDMRGNARSQGLWITAPVDGMDGFIIIDDEEALRWIGEIGGQLPHVDHPHGSLISLPRSAQIPVGTILSVGLDAMFGTPPYVPSLIGSHPPWVSIREGGVRIRPPLNALVGRFQFTVRATDANDETADTTFRIVVTPSQD